MLMREKVLISWSGGRDSAMALLFAETVLKYEVAGLLTIVNNESNAVSMHGISSKIVRMQAESLGVPLTTISMPEAASNVEYEKALFAVLLTAKQQGITGVVYGDIFLEEIRQYREQVMKQIGLKAFFPLWGSNTDQLSLRFIQEGFRAIITCIDTKKLSDSYLGAPYDFSLLTNLPAEVDRCGENGEFHSFVYDGPLFKKPIHYRSGCTRLLYEQYRCLLISNS
ncbi:diphthine--ammonia ligase [Bacillus lacus]|uniref:Diphthine--ammonia ligase n=1 Tax=Metabacillus lacus TaxID=1983721 RepID=A0A7X2M0W3_9BACI|nr:diphthine--ammonia ligase [Metabacillus lacus]MRX73339.1 diphthine--ammonia ligase [Metabacillus lacus]